MPAHIHDRPLHTLLFHHVVDGLNEATLGHLFEVDVELSCVVLYLKMTILASFLVLMQDSLDLDLLSSLIFKYFLLINAYLHLFWRFKLSDAI